MSRGTDNCPTLTHQNPFPRGPGTSQTDPFLLKPKPVRTPGSISRRTYSASWQPPLPLTRRGQRCSPFGTGSRARPLTAIKWDTRSKASSPSASRASRAWPPSASSSPGSSWTGTCATSICRRSTPFPGATAATRTIWGTCPQARALTISWYAPSLRRCTAVRSATACARRMRALAIPPAPEFCVTTQRLLGGGGLTPPPPTRTPPTPPP